MRRITTAVLATGFAVALTACTSSAKTGGQDSGGSAQTAVGGTATGGTATTASTPPATPTTAVVSPSGTSVSTSAAPPPSVGVTASVAGVATSFDPCQLVPAAEASAVAGVTFGAGEEQPGGESKRCVYGGQTLNVFTVEVAQAADAAAAQAAFSQTEAQVNAALQKQLPPGIGVAFNSGNLTGLGDKAATVSGTATFSGKTIGISGIYVLKGATFFAFQDLRLGSPPTAGALQAEAQKVLGRV